jgi:hypothetical protein
MCSIGLSLDADNGDIGAQRSKLSSGGAPIPVQKSHFTLAPSLSTNQLHALLSSVVPNAMSPKTRRQHAIMALDLWAQDIHYGTTVPFTRFIAT